MTKKGKWIVFTMFLMSTVQASEIKFEAFPKELKTNLTEFVSMRCSVRDTTIRATLTAADIQHISSIFIYRNKKDLASMTPFIPATALEDLGNMEAKGAISGIHSGEGYIELTWKDPSLMYLGEYQCTVTAVDSRGHSVTLSSELQMKAVPPSIMDVIAEFKSKFVKQEQLIEAQQHELSTQKLQIENQQHDFNAQIDNLTQEITRQQLLNNNQTKEIDNQNACTSPRIGFTATLMGALTVGRGQVVKYDHAPLNEGGDYNVSTGEFLCRQPGMYTFSVHATSSSNSVCVELQLNSVLVNALYANNQSQEESASTGATLHLQTGDVVRVYTCQPSYFGFVRYHSNSFTGVLIQSDACLP